MEAVDAHNRGLEAKKWSPGGSVDSYQFVEEQDLDMDPHSREKINPDPDPEKLDSFSGYAI